MLQYMYKSLIEEYFSPHVFWSFWFECNTVHKLSFVCTYFFKVANIYCTVKDALNNTEQNLCFLKNSSYFQCLFFFFKIRQKRKNLSKLTCLNYVILLKINSRLFFTSFCSAYVVFQCKIFGKFVLLNRFSFYRSARRACREGWTRASRYVFWNMIFS